MITIINYGLGNVRAFANLYRRLNIPVAIAARAQDLDGASKLIMPGVGAFDHAMELLNGSGMQILAGSSEEGRLPGLGWIEGRVRRFDETSLPRPPRLPHMGWNDVVPK